MKKILCIWVFLVLVIVTLTSCSFRDTSGAITITLSGWQSNPNEKQLLEQVLNKFEAQHLNIKVKHEVINDQYMDVIKTRLIGDAAPNEQYGLGVSPELSRQYFMMTALGGSLIDQRGNAAFSNSSGVKYESLNWDKNYPLRWSYLVCDYYFFTVCLGAFCIF
jgi:ABC-type glycerol-3-phosphate transport system substrate-binding protein